MEKVVYKEMAEHEYVHVLTLSDENHSRSEPEGKIGTLTLHLCDQTFAPQQWNFTSDEYMDGVHHESGITTKLQPNEPPAIENTPLWDDAFLDVEALLNE